MNWSWACPFNGSDAAALTAQSLAAMQQPYCHIARLIQILQHIKDPTNMSPSWKEDILSAIFKMPFPWVPCSSAGSIKHSLAAASHTAI